jgi:hypothetical protein
LISLQDVKNNGIWRNGERGEMGNDKKDKDVIVISLSPASPFPLKKGCMFL